MSLRKIKRRLVSIMGVKQTCFMTRAQSNRGVPTFWSIPRHPIRPYIA